MTDPAAPPWLHLVSAFHAMETADSVVSLAKVCGGGSITEKVQRFVWNHCISEAAGKGHAPYLKSFLKKLISEIESNCSEVLDELYEQYAYLMTSMKDGHSVKGNSRVFKYITFLFPDGCIDLPSCPKSRKLMVPLQCSLNMIEGDTGCSIWPSSLFLSEFILSFPDIFSNKSCFEIITTMIGFPTFHVHVAFTNHNASVGSGVGLVGICLAHVKASKVKCIYLPWESASESEIHAVMPEIILAADVIYNPECFPHLVQLLAILINRRNSFSQSQDENSLSEPDITRVGTKLNGAIHDFKTCEFNGGGFDACKRAPGAGSREHPIAYIATVIRNIDTFNYFLELAEQASLIVTDITETLRLLNLLPYMQSYDRSSIRLFTVSSK